MARSRSLVASGLKNVPPFPPVAAKLLGLLSNSSVPTREVANLIGSDATFAARILQRVNSAQFALETPVSNVQHAVALLGIDQIRQITVIYATRLYSKEAVKTEDLRRCWRHMVATAVLAEIISEACGEYSSAAFTAGMIHDIGRLALLIAYPDEYERLISNAAERCMDVLDYETEEFGMHHAEAGRMLTELWGLPEEFAGITGRHHDQWEGGELDLVGIVHLACKLADVLGYDFVRPLVQQDISSVLAHLPPKARERLQVKPEDLCAHIEERINEFDSPEASLPAESSLALLASSVAETAGEASGQSTGDSAVELSPTPQDDQEPASPNKDSRYWIAVALLICFVIGVFVWRLM